VKKYFTKLFNNYGKHEDLGLSGDLDLDVVIFGAWNDGAGVDFMKPFQPEFTTNYNT
jgi:hypothetical protein